MLLREHLYPLNIPAIQWLYQVLPIVGVPESRWFALSPVTLLQQCGSIEEALYTASGAVETRPWLRLTADTLLWLLGASGGGGRVLTCALQ